MSYTETKQCRLCGSTKLIPILELGKMALTGVFPESPAEKITTGPLSLVFCPDSGLVQLGQSYDLNEMYGDNYGYRSGLNASMVKHLQAKVAQLQRIRPVDAESLVIDIGGNDGTLLKAYDIDGLRRFCVDPTAQKWADHYCGTDIVVIPDFFEASFFEEAGRKADIITSIAMFYDLENPHDFVRDIARTLKDDGIWHFEQSYLLSMLEANAYDTICHEHLEFYSLRVVQELLHLHGLKIIDVQFNSVNGGSFAVTAAHKGSRYITSNAVFEALRKEPTTWGWLDLLHNFAAAVEEHREDLRSLLKFLRDEGKTVAALGASTKGNVLLQYCGLTHNEIQFIGDVNPEKFGRITPGTHIPIIDEVSARKLKPDYMLVLPWHFREGIIEREKAYLEDGGALIFPLPRLEIVTRETLKHES